MQRFQTIVLGLGAMGSATLYQLARRGHAVLGIDQFSPPHELGSTHGDTRVTRRAIGEGGEYVTLACRSHEIWREIESSIGKELLREIGCLVISSDAPRATVHVPTFFKNTVETARKHGIAHERLDAAAIRQRYPQFAVRDDEFGYFEPGAGFLWVEECVRAQLQLPDLLEARYRAPFSVSRQVLAWFDLADAGSPFLAPDCPVFIWELQGKDQDLYGFPAVDGAGGGVKVSSEQYTTTTTPAAVDRQVSQEEAATIYRRYVAGHLQGVTERCIRSCVCLYTNLPGARFVIDQHPDEPRMTIVSPCSGHGFKHSAAIGEALAQRIIDGESRIDLKGFSFARVLEHDLRSAAS